MKRYLPALEKKKLRNDVVLTHKIFNNKIDLEATWLFKFPRRLRLKRSSLRLLYQAGRTRRSRNTFSGRGIKCWNCLPYEVTSMPGPRTFKKTSTHVFDHILNSIFAPIWFLWATCPFPINKWIHTCITLSNCQISPAILRPFYCAITLVVSRTLNLQPTEHHSDLQCWSSNRH